MMLNEFCQVTPVLDIEKVKARKDLPEIRNKEDLLNILGSELICAPFEQCLCIFFDSSCHFISYAVIGRGTPWSTPQDVATIISCCLLLNASQIIIMHNHPMTGYDPVGPSRQDIKMTIQLKHFLETVFAIKLLDSLVVCDIEDAIVMKSILKEISEQQKEKQQETEKQEQVFL